MKTLNLFCKQFPKQTVIGLFIIEEKNCQCDMTKVFSAVVPLSTNRLCFANVLTLKKRILMRILAFATALSLIILIKQPVRDYS